MLGSLLLWTRNRYFFILNESYTVYHINVWHWVFDFRLMRWEFDFEIQTPVIFNFWPVFHSKLYSPHRYPGRNRYQKMWNLCIFWYLCEKFARGCSPTQTPTQKFEHGFLRFRSQEIGSSLVSLKRIFENWLLSNDWKGRPSWMFGTR